MATFTLMTTEAGLKAPRLTGTLTSNGTTTVVGVGTEFVAELAGYSFRFVGGTVDYTVASVTDATHLTTTAVVPAGSGQVAFLSSEQGLLEANFHLLGSAAKSNATAFQVANASTTLLGNNTTGTGVIVRQTSPTLITPNLGTATASSLKTGYVCPSADGATAFQVRKADASTSVVNVDTTNGRLGVGTTAPAAKTDILATTEQLRLSYDASHYASATVNANGNLTVTPNGGTMSVTGIVAPTSLKTSCVYAATDSTTAFQVRKADASTSVVNVDTTNGRLGVGTTAPAAKADILATTEQLRLSYDASHYTSATVDANGNLTVTPNGGSLLVQRPTGAGWAVQAYSTGIGNGSGLWFDSSNNGQLALRDGTGALTTVIYSNGGSYINGGYLGIGTTAPGRRLDVLHTNPQLRVSYNSSVYTDFFTDASGNLKIMPSSNDTIYTDGVQNIRMYYGGGQPVTVSTNGWSVFANGIRTLYTTSVPGMNTNGQMAVACVSNSNRIYFYSNGGTRYCTATGGFEVPGHERIDPLSPAEAAETLDIGDIVVGTLNANVGDGETAETSSLHGLWTTLSSGLRKLGGATKVFTVGGIKFTVVNGLIMDIAPSEEE